MGTYSDIRCERAFEKALSLCKGTYQKNLVHGVESLSGSTLTGKAKNWGGKYAQSRNSLLKRLEDANLAMEAQGSKGKRILVIDDFTLPRNRIVGLIRWLPSSAPLEVLSLWVKGVFRNEELISLIDQQSPVLGDWIEDHGGKREWSGLLLTTPTVRLVEQLLLV